MGNMGQVTVTSTLVPIEPKVNAYHRLGLLMHTHSKSFCLRFNSKSSLEGQETQKKQAAKINHSSAVKKGSRHTPENTLAMRLQIW